MGGSGWRGCGVSREDSGNLKPTPHLLPDTHSMSTGLCPRDIPEASQPRSHHPIQASSPPTGTLFTSSLAWKPPPPRITFLSHRSEKVLTVKPPLPSLCPASGPPQFRRVPRGAVRARAEGRVLGSPLPAPSSAAEKAQAVLPGGCEDWSLLPSLIRVLSLWACAPWIFQIRQNRGKHTQP